MRPTIHLRAASKWNSVQKKQRRHYSGKKKDHTIKVQLTIDLNTEKAPATAFAPGCVHDLVLFQDPLHEVSLAIPCLFDKGYQGIQHQLSQACLPFKASRGRPPSLEQRDIKRLRAAIRIGVEHVIRSL